MRIWDLKHGTSLHVLKGKEEVYHLCYSLVGKQPLLVGSDLCLDGEEASSEGRRKPGTGFLCPHWWLLLVGLLAEPGRVEVAGWCVSRLTGSLWGGNIKLIPAAHPPGQDGHQDPLTCVASNQDGSLIMTGSVDCHAKLVNSATGKVRLCGQGRARRAEDPPKASCPGPGAEPGALGIPQSLVSRAEGRARSAGDPPDPGPVCGHWQPAGGALALRMERGLGGPARLLGGSSLLFAPRS